MTLPTFFHILLFEILIPLALLAIAFLFLEVLVLELLWFVDMLWFNWRERRKARSFKRLQ